jgi:hypothetical protein
MGQRKSTDETTACGILENFEKTRLNNEVQRLKLNKATGAATIRGFGAVPLKLIEC